MALPMPDPIDAFAATLLPIGQAPASPPIGSAGPSAGGEAASDEEAEEVGN